MSSLPDDAFPNPAKGEPFLLTPGPLTTIFGERSNAARLGVMGRGFPGHDEKHL